MSKHRFDNDANELIQYFTNTINWVKHTFNVYRSDMKGLEWGILYNKYKEKNINPIEIEKELKRLYDLYEVDPDGLKKKGFYEYCLSGDRTLIWHRAFSDRQQKQAYDHQKGKCARCGRAFALKEWIASCLIKVYKNNGSETAAVIFVFRAVVILPQLLRFQPWHPSAGLLLQRLHVQDILK